MTESHSGSYSDAGVDITAGYRAVDLMRSHVRRTAIPGVLGDLGGFGGLFELDLTGIEKPILVSGTDGVGTKLKLAFLLDRHETVGIDCVAMCVNDILCCGAKPLFFLDYIACAKNIPERIAAVVSGVADGCMQAGAALVGGETAEMPGFYAEGEYDLAGFCVGLADKNKLIDREAQRPGDVLIALASSGVHSNGFSLIRRALDLERADLNAPVPELGGKNLGETLLCPTKIYARPVLELMKHFTIKGAAHITGGGLFENIPRGVKPGLGAAAEKSALRIPPVFSLIAERGGIPEHDMFNTFNMGVGMCLIVSASDAGGALRLLRDTGEDAFVIGELAAMDEGLRLC